MLKKLSDTLSLLSQYYASFHMQTFLSAYSCSTMVKRCLFLLTIYVCYSCNQFAQKHTEQAQIDGKRDTNSYIIEADYVKPLPSIGVSKAETEPLPATSVVDTKNVNPVQLVNYAQTLIGIPYKYGSTNPTIGFDCSGFITYVFNHFNIAVPRSSEDFLNVGTQVSLKESKPGDLILFTGTDSTIHHIGHMGIIVKSSANEMSFIHSTSGKANSVTITPLNSYYQGRFYSVRRVFIQNNKP